MSFWCLHIHIISKKNENKSTSGIIVVKLNCFVCFLEELKIPKSPFEINWPLVVACYKRLRVQETTRNLRKALKGTTRLEMTGILSEVLLIPTIFRQRLIFSCMFFFADWIGVEIFSWKSRGGLATYYTESLIVVNHTNMAPSWK